MSEPLIERLSRFTPDSTGLDRDGLLFAAGRASARPGRRWKGLAAILAVSQVLTLVLLWPRPAPPSPDTPIAAPAPPVVIEPAPLASEPPPLLVLRQQALATEGNLPSPVPVEAIAPSEPPLRAFGPPSGDLLN
jgi:hypothetical protein